jgi:hypothetical protein
MLLVLSGAEVANLQSLFRLRHHASCGATWVQPLLSYEDEIHCPRIVGIDVDSQLQCVHYRTVLDVIAIK